MNDEDLKKIRGVVREVVTEGLKPVETQLGVVGSELGTVKSKLGTVETEIGTVKSKLGTVETEIGTVRSELGTVRSELGVVKKRVDDMWEQTVKLSEDMEEVKESLKLQTSAAKHNDDNVSRLNKRLTLVEEQHGVIPPPELAIIH